MQELKLEVAQCPSHLNLHGNRNYATGGQTDDKTLVNYDDDDDNDKTDEDCCLGGRLEEFGDAI